MKRIKSICKHKWEVIRTIWPYKYGYGTICKRCNTLLDSGLEKKKAKQVVKKMNKELKNEKNKV